MKLEKIEKLLSNIYFKVFCLIIVLIYISIESLGTGDFYIYFTASSKVFGTESIYKISFNNGFYYLYSLSFALFLHLFTYLPFYICKFSWLVLNAFLLYRLFKIILSYLDFNSNDNNIPSWFYALIFLYSFRFIHENFHTSQITIVILYICIESMNLIFNKKLYLYGALLLAIGINIKLLPIVLLPYLFYRGKFKASFLVITFCLILWTLPILFLGYEKNMVWLHDWWKLLNPTAQKNVLDVDEISFHSLTTLISVLFYENPPDMYALDIKRNVLSLPIHQIAIVINVVRVILISLTLYFLNTKPFVHTISKSHQLYEMSYLLALVPLIFPHQQHYAFLFLLPAITILLYIICFKKEMLKPNYYKYLYASLVFIYLIFNLKIILGEFNPFYEHFKIITYGALWLVISLFLKPVKSTLINNNYI